MSDDPGRPREALRPVEPPPKPDPNPGQQVLERLRRESLRHRPAVSEPGPQAGHEETLRKMLRADHKMGAATGIRTHQETGRN